MPEGYRFLPDPNEVAHVALGKSTWAVLGLTCRIELFTQQHYEQSIEPDGELSPLRKDVFLFHWKEESQHAIMDELEWAREDVKLTNAERDQAVTDVIDLAVAGILQARSAADAEYFLLAAGRVDDTRSEAIRKQILKAYRWQYIVSGVKSGRFLETLTGMLNPSQIERIGMALAPLMRAADSSGERR